MSIVAPWSPVEFSLTSEVLQHLRVSLPTVLFGESITWDTDYRPSMVYVCQMPWRKRTVYVCGTRWDLRRSSLRQSGGPISFIVVSGTPEGLSQTLLSQFMNIVYEPKDGLFTLLKASTMKKLAAVLSPNGVPSWKWSSEYWPSISQNDPLEFIGQVRIQDSAFASEHLMNNVDLRLFGWLKDGEPQFAITTQFVPYKTPDEVFEEEMNRSKAKPSKIKKQKRKSSPDQG